MTRQVKPAPHEFAGNLIFQGLEPYFALYSELIGNREGTAELELWALGQEWTASWYYQRSGIAPPDGELPSGTTVEFDTIREFRCQITGPARQKVNLHIAPRWPGMESKDGERISIPPNLGESINVRVSGSNVPFEAYHRLLVSAFQVLGVSKRYVSDPHEYSNITDAELYVRLTREAAEPVHARDGTLAALGHVLENDRSGYRAITQDDTDIAGYYHTVTLGERRIREVWPGHSLPKEIKHYHPRHVQDDPQSPLYHPKLGVSYQTSIHDDPLFWADLDQLQLELEDTLWSVLDDSDLDPPTTDDPYPFVPDDVFRAETQQIERDVIQLDLSAIEHQQENLVIQCLADGLSPVEFEALEYLVTDGGETSPNELAEEYDRHPDSVRRALGRLEGLVSREYGSVSLESRHIAELVHQAVERAREHTRRAVDASGTAIAAAARGLTEAEAKLRVWASKHGINLRRLSDGAAEVVVDASDPIEARRMLAKGLELWMDTGRDPTEFRQSRLAYRTPRGRLTPIPYLSTTDVTLR